MSAICKPLCKCRRARGFALGVFVVVLAAGAGCEREAAPGASKAEQGETAQSETGPAERTAWFDTSPPKAVEQAAAVPTEKKSDALEERDEAPRKVVVPRLAPWRHARVGQWAGYEMLDGYAQRLTVVGVTADEVELRLEMFRAGRAIGLPATKTLPVDHDAALDDPRLAAAEAITGEPVEVVASEETVQAAGQAWAARKTRAAWEEEGVRYERTTWVSPSAPLSGLMRQETRADGELTHRTELVGFGARDGQIVDP